MQPVQTFMRLGVPPTRARTRWMFGFQRRLVRRCENETFMPNDGFLPQISQTDAMMNVLLGRTRHLAHRTKPSLHCSISNNDHSVDAVRARTAFNDRHVL